ncbi:hypothetical protein JS533_011455 [Bifidobacterium amazonense]|uniref:Uncharacterized protein n=1 Tax=Bifidobacterium amazonense TaxID=2809027 RepID=A0ABS9VXS4_9BIFI|nr:hypothetical protein [Bifidobacterium amazonense]MCH9276879.1 hypothetical protein [Bifidobacterium amazonense]
MDNDSLMSLLPLFTAENVPERGPEEADPPERDWSVDSDAQGLARPGGGLSRYSMLYIGEGYNTIMLIDRGKIIWTYSTEPGWEYDDIWMLRNGNIVFSRMSWVGEVTPDKRLVWRYDAEPGTEIHAVQPIDDRHLLMMVNGRPPRAVIIDRTTSGIVKEMEVPCDPSVSVHGQFRRIRYTANHTLLVPHMTEEKVVEYDLDMHPIWQYDNVAGPWAAIRLKNGNTLISAERENRTLEVTPAGETVWQLRMDDVDPAYRMEASQTCVRLANGNTVLCSRGNKGETPQLLEVDANGHVVWSVYDWERLGPATSVQILSEPGVSEIPGSCER